MNIFYDFIKQSSPSCVAVGCFDGIHIGHRKIISDMCRYAVENNLTSSVFTFSNSPSAVLGGMPAKAIISQNDKLNILDSIGVQNCFSLEFQKVMNISPEKYISDILVDRLNVKAVFCGFNYRFGKKALGDCILLKDVCSRYTVKVFVTSPVCCGEEVVSSSRIRRLIENGDIVSANKLLDRHFAVEGKIVEGMHNGRTIGIPTVNQLPAFGFVTPKNGVYASVAHLDGKSYNAVTNIGTRPTVNGTFTNIETHLLNAHIDEAYGKMLRTELLYFVRPERSFNNLTELSDQIHKDIEYISLHRIFEKYQGGIL